MKDERVKRGQSPAMNKAQRLIMQGHTVSESAKKAGVQVNSIYRRPWYKLHIASKGAKNAD